jgi:CHAT domain-containing protein
VDALVTQATYPPSPEKWPFVVRQTLISYGWSLRTLREQLIATGRGSAFSGFFLSANNSGSNPGANTAAIQSSPLLKATHAESAGIKQIIKEGSWYTDEQATTNAFRKALQVSSVVHISSHAFTKKDGLEIPHIELFDEPFYLFELKGLEYHPALVVLSACRTGDGRMVMGEGVQSLARAFIAGGTNAVVASWWNVNDEAAAQLMQKFYAAFTAKQEPAGSPVSVAGALRNAKLEWLQDTAVPYLHKLPYYWAALNYLGNPAPLQQRFGHDKAVGNGVRMIRSWWWVILLVLLVPVVMLVIRKMPAIRKRY